MSRKTIRIGYVTQIYPLLTETFVYREIFGLTREGLNISTFAIWKPDKSKLSAESRHLVDNTYYVFPIKWVRFITNHFCFLFRNPKKYLGTLSFVLTRQGESIKNRLRTFYHFCEAVYLATDVEQEGVRHMHAHFCINAATVAMVLARLLDISFSFTTHNSLFTDQLLLKDKIRKARFVIVISEFNRRFITNLLPEEDYNDKIHTIHCGLPLADFSPPAIKPVNKIPIILFVSQLAERKGTRFLVKACRILVDRGCAFRCVLVGDGPERSLIEDLIMKLKLEGVIESAGIVFQEKIKSFLHQADMFVLPCVVANNNDVDGIPTVLMEAMATELPVVSTKVSGVPELVIDEQTGLVVKEKDEIALADAMQRLLTDEELRLRLGKKGRQHVIREFNVEKNAVKLATIFENYTKVGRVR